jgi:Membrane domain of glycerophosphoryl diester phosphodiesterase
MRFDSSKAWNEAIARIRSNFNVLIPLGGIFLLLPTLGLGWFSTDLQLELSQTMAQAKPGELPPGFLPLMGQFFAITLVLGFFQSIGTMAMLALFFDQARPTVGEALARSLRCLPTQIGTTLLLLLGGLFALIPLALVVGLVAGALALLGSAALSGVVAAGLMLAAILVAFARFCVVSPAIVIDGQSNPLEAIGRSWNLTKGNTWPLAFFIFLLTVAYLVIVLAAQALMGLALGLGAMSDAVQFAQAGTGVQVLTGLVLGLIGAVATVIFTGVTGAIHNQLSGGSPGELGDTFA